MLLRQVVVVELFANLSYQDLAFTGNTAADKFWAHGKQEHVFFTSSAPTILGSFAHPPMSQVLRVSGFVPQDSTTCTHSLHLSSKLARAINGLRQLLSSRLAAIALFCRCVPYPEWRKADVVRVVTAVTQTSPKSLLFQDQLPHSSNIIEPIELCACMMSARCAVRARIHAPKLDQRRS